MILIFLSIMHEFYCINRNYNYLYGAHKIDYTHYNKQVVMSCVNWQSISTLCDKLVGSFPFSFALLHFNIVMDSIYRTKASFERENKNTKIQDKNDMNHCIFRFDLPVHLSGAIKVNVLNPILWYYSIYLVSYRDNKSVLSQTDKSYVIGFRPVVQKRIAWCL